jgi:hypothetical protein
MKAMLLLLGTIALALSACGPSGTNCDCVSTAACSTLNQATQSCGVGLVCCPALPDGGH